MIEMKIPLTVRMLSVIRRAKPDLPFSEYMRCYATVPHEESERQISVHNATLHAGTDGRLTLVLPGDDGSVTRFTYAQGGDALCVVRTGEVSYQMKFAPGARDAFTAKTPFGEMAGETVPLDLRTELSAAGGRLAVRYLAKIGGVLEEATVMVTVIS